MIGYYSNRTRIVVHTAFAALALIVAPKDSYAYGEKSYKRGNTIAHESDERPDRVVYRDNAFDYDTAGRGDKFRMVDVATGGPAGNMTRGSGVIPVKMNGTPILRMFEVTTQPEQYASTQPVAEYIFSRIAGDLNELPDDTYLLDVNNLVIDTTGRIVYYEGIGLCHYVNLSSEVIAMSNAMMLKIDDIIHAAPAWKPAKRGDRKAQVLCDIFLTTYEITVKDHLASIKKRWDYKLER